MKKKFTFLLAVLALLTMMVLPGKALAESETITFSELGLENGVQYTDPFGTNISVTFSGGGNTGMYYNTGNGIRIYGDGVVTITANGNTVTNISTTFSGGSYCPSANTVWASNGTNTKITSGANASWTGTATSVTMTRPSGSGHWRMQVITVTYTNSGGSTYSVTYNANGATSGSVPTDATAYNDGGEVTVIGNTGSLAKTGNTWYGWNTQANGEGTNYSAGDKFNIHENTTLYAKWTKNKYSVALSSVANVTLTATYGSPANTITEGNSASIDYGTEITLNAADLESGKAFNWQITKTSGGDDVTATVLSGTTLTVPDYNITIGGTVVSTYSVTYDCNSGTSGCPSTDPITGIAEGTVITLADAPSRTGYIFNGWNDGTNTHAAGSSYTVNSTVTLTAQWSAGGTGTIYFCGTATQGKTLINSTLVTGNDNLGNTWTITTAPSTVSFGGTSSYAQVGTGNGNGRATSIEFTMTLSGTNQITGLSADFGCFQNTSGTVTLKVGETVVGTHTISGSNDFTVTNSQNALGNVLTVLVEGTTMRMKCYSISYTYTPTGSDPIINAPNTVNISSTDTNNEFAFEIANPVGGKTLSATTTTDWISNVSVDNTNNKVSFTTTENTSTSDARSGSITLSYDGADNKVVTINQSKVDYATMPLYYNDGKNDLPTGFTDGGLGSDYSDANSKLKFDTEGDYLILKLREAPVSLSYTIKGNSFSAGVFDVQTSVDGETYNNLATYNYSNISSENQTITHIDLGSTVRYIKWVFTDKISGNIGIGNIHATTEYDIYGIATTVSLAPTSEKKCTIYNGGKLTVTGTLTNTTEANLVVEDGGQLITSSPVKATVKKTVAEWAGSKADDDGWYAISSPVNNIAITDFVKGTHNVYRYDEPTAYWNEYRSDDGVYESFEELENGRGYLYRSTSDEGIEFKGTVNSADVTYPLSFAYDGIYSDLKGFNLVGNPFTHDIELSDMTFVNAFDDGFYMLGEEDGEYKGKWIASTSTTKVAPTKAFLVQATGASASITINNNVPAATKGSNYANDNIMFVVKNAEYSDEAYVLFKKGHGLNKIEHRNAEIPMLYVISEGENYAIADMPDNTDVINLGFEAKTMGQYTISLKADGQYSYMHLVDKLTGNDIDMLVEDSYTFVGTPNDRNDRFVLRLNYNAAGIDTESDIFAYQSGNDIMVSGEGELQVFDITGRKVMTTDINGVETINGMNRGVYIFRLNEKTQKIVVR
ncbi:MAG: InlB B-repeat-containing protein [Bacteroidales bacterium]|nr:InlB B-repeat-containing protein [Bacteroidales bacterium]